MRSNPALSRAHVEKIEQGKVDDREQAAKMYAKQVSAANLAQVKAMLAADIEILRSKLPGKSEEAAEHALNMKYLRDRQQIPTRFA